MVSIAQAIFLLESKQTDRQTKNRQKRRPTHVGGYTACVGKKRTFGMNGAHSEVKETA